MKRKDDPVRIQDSWQSLPLVPPSGSLQSQSCLCYGWRFYQPEFLLDNASLPSGHYIGHHVGAA